MDDGGVLLAFLNTLNITECPLVDMYNYEIIAATLTYIWGTENYLSTYRPPTTDSTYLQNLIQIFKDLIHANPATLK